MELILQSVGATDFKVYLTDSLGNFRNSISSFYKSNRSKESPVWLEDLKEHLITVWGAKISLGQEADDALGIEQTKMAEGTVICSIDKDLLQIPGYHYNFVRFEHVFVTPEEGMYNFYKQLIVGDSTDNVNGCPKKGEVKAASILLPFKGSTNELEIFEAVREAYRDYYTKKGLTDEAIDDIILMNGQLLYIRKKEEEMWNFPTKNTNTSPQLQSQEEKLSSTISTEEALSLCTELTTLEMMTA